MKIMVMIQRGSASPEPSKQDCEYKEEKVTEGFWGAGSWAKEGTLGKEGGRICEGTEVWKSKLC